MQQVQISSAEHRRLLALKEAAARLNSDFIPKVNFGASCISAEAASVLNDFGIALRNLQDLSADMPAGRRYPCVVRDLYQGRAYSDFTVRLFTTDTNYILLYSFPLDVGNALKSSSDAFQDTADKLNIPAYDNVVLLKYRVWPDATVQCTEDGMPHDWLPDNYKVVEAASEAHALIIAGLLS